jgi:hypothetical protein
VSQKQKSLLCVTCDREFDEDDIPDGTLEVNDHDGLRTLIFPNGAAHMLSSRHKTQEAKANAEIAESSKGGAAAGESRNDDI